MPMGTGGSSPLMETKDPDCDRLPEEEQDLDH